MHKQIALHNSVLQLPSPAITTV